MADLTDLPTELLDQILNTLTTHQLSRLLRVSHSWYQLLVPRLYLQWNCNGARHKTTNLWRFLRTVITNPDLVAEGWGWQRRWQRRPVVGLLLASLPCVSTEYAHIPASDPFPKGILRTALDQQQAHPDTQSPLLSNVKELNVLRKVPGFTEGDPDTLEPPLVLDDIGLIFYLRGLRRVRLHNLDMDGISSLLQHQGECHI
ncbi:hypothetical protein BDW62DRAFT_206075 [Aspergillus aurantiobrunneus]